VDGVSRQVPVSAHTAAWKDARCCSVVSPAPGKGLCNVGVPVGRPLTGQATGHQPAQRRRPNTITLLGLMCQVVTLGVLVQYCPTLTEPAPAWTAALAGAALFTYSTLDNMDGKQARRTGSSSPLGLLFDHGCDGLNAGEARAGDGRIGWPGFLRPRSAAPCLPCAVARGRPAAKLAPSPRPPCAGPPRLQACLARSS
jgi:hypothetical protein